MGNNTLTDVENIFPTYVGSMGVLQSDNMAMEFFEFNTEDKETFVAFQGIMKSRVFEKMIDGLGGQEILESKIRLLKAAFKNRTKQYHFSQLNCRFLDKEISELEYENEIKEYPNKYEILIPTTPVRLGELDILTDLISDLRTEGLLDEDITVDEVSELFEVNLQNAVNRISKLKLGY